MNGDPLSSTLVSIEGDYLVVDLSQGVRGQSHDFYLIGTTLGGVSLSEKLTISFSPCDIKSLSSELDS
jgi:hypothetical protein